MDISDFTINQEIKFLNSYGETKRGRIVKLNPSFHIVTIGYDLPSGGYREENWHVSKLTWVTVAKND